MNWPIFSGIWILSPSLSEKKEKEKTLSELDLCGKNFWMCECIFVRIQLLDVYHHRETLRYDEKRKRRMATVLLAKSDSDVIFCFQRYEGLMIDRSLVH